MAEPHFPEDGILWHTWSEETLQKIADRNRPVLLLDMDPDPMVWPFLRAIYQEAPRNARLRELLHEEFIALFVTADALPAELSMFGAGSRYHLAVLSPSGLNPLVTFVVQRGDTSKLIEEVVAVLERLLEAWR
jgi:hypothetical protein